MVEHRRNSVPTLEDVAQAARVHIDGGRGAGAAPRRAGYRREMSAHGLAEHIQGQVERHGLSVPGDISAINDRGDLPDCVMTPRLVVRQTTAG